MSESKFTPGPWNVEVMPSETVTVTAGQFFIAGNESSLGLEIGNAKLISAAPDLMELANRVIEEFKNYERIGEICPFEGQSMIYASVLLELAEFAKIAQAKATA